jgi:hypothetical protein
MATATQDAAEQEECQEAGIDKGTLNGCVFGNDPNYCRHYPRWKCGDFC